MFDRNRFRYYLAKRGKTQECVAEYLGINSATLYRKMTGSSDFTRQEIQDTKELLSLSDEEAMSIFFAR